MVRKAPTKELHELVRSTDETMYRALAQSKLKSVDELSSVKGFEERIEQLFNDFKQSHPGEDVEEMKKVAIIGIPNYISSARKAERYNRNTTKMVVVSSPFLIGGFLSIPISILTRNPVPVYIGGPAGIGGIIAIFSSVFRSNDHPLTVYREQYRSQIMDAYQK